MASEAILKQLFEVAKASLYFKGLSEEDIWKACESYQDRSDEDIEVAMQNIRAEDEKILAERDLKKNQMESNKARMGALREEEALDRRNDESNASEILDNFFNS